jgi:hypothetical protein
MNPIEIRALKRQLVNLEAQLAARRKTLALYDTQLQPPGGLLAGERLDLEHRRESEAKWIEPMETRIADLKAEIARLEGVKRHG